MTVPALKPDHVSHSERYTLKHPDAPYAVAAVSRLTHSTDAELTYAIEFQSMYTNAELRALGQHLVAVADLDQHR